MRESVGLEGGGGATDAGALSNAPQDRAGVRLGRLGLLIAATIGILQLISFGVSGAEEWLPTPATSRGQSTKAALVVLSLLAYALSTSQSLRRRTVLWGSAYQLLGAGCIAVSQYWGAHDISAGSGNQAFLAVWIVLFPLVVPASPTQNGLVAFGRESDDRDPAPNV